MARELTQLDLLRELAPVAEDNVNRHLKIAKNWNPHDYVPWDEGRNFAALGGVDYDPEQSQLDEVAKAAMITNLLTEDNLPSYHRVIADNFTLDDAAHAYQLFERHAREGAAAWKAEEAARARAAGFRGATRLVFAATPARLAVLGLLGAGLSGCIGEELRHGYQIDQAALAAVKPGMSPEQVLQTLGTPSTVSTVGNKSWYYISQNTRRTVMFMGESVEDQKVVAEMAVSTPIGIGKAMTEFLAKSGGDTLK